VKGRNEDRKADRTVFRPPVQSEIDAELEFHVEMRVRELMAKGVSAEEARARVMVQVGDLETIRRECAALGRSRDRKVNMVGRLAELGQDMRYALRQIALAPAFALAAVLTLALGIGGTTAIFSVVHAVILRPFAFTEPARVVMVAEAWGDQAGWGDVSAGNFVDWREMSESFAAMAAVNWSSFNLATDDAPERVLGVRATYEYFDVFGIRPVHGRTFTAAEDEPGRDQVVVLSHDLWQERYGADAGILGREIRLNGRPHVIIGVMPETFDPYASNEQLWVPAAFTPERRRMHDEHYLNVAARLAPGVTMEEAQAELDRIAIVMQERFPHDNAGRGIFVMPFEEAVIDGNLRTRLFILLGAVGLVLLIACGNVANLLLARGANRASEMAVRAAMGAGRSRLVRQLLTESIVLSLLAALAGTLLAFAGVRALVAAAPPGVPRLEEAAVDGIALAFALGISVLSGLVFGLAPALRVARDNVYGSLRESGRGTVSGRDRLRGVFVAAEVALAFTLLTGAGLLIRSALLLGQENPGFNAAGVLTARVSLPPAAYGEGEGARRTFGQLVDRLAVLPGVAAASISSQVPAGPGGGSNGLIPEGRIPSPENSINTRLRIVTPGYFATLGIPLLSGRDFNAADVRTGNLVMVVSRRLAEQAWPGEDAIGRRMLCCEGSESDPMWKTVVGIAEDVQSRGPGQGITPEFYLPLAQVPPVAFSWIQSTMTMVGRSAVVDDVEPVAQAMRAAVADVAADVPVFDVQTMDQRLRATYATSRFNAQLLGVLGAIGLLLSIIGIYSVVAYHASRRMHEMGLRIALGATARDVLALITRQGLRPVVLGLGAGMAAALAATRLLQSALFGVTASDPVTFGTVAGLLLCAALVAAVLPARRASRLDPGRVLTRS
jgi:predicted permease